VNYVSSHGKSYNTVEEFNMRQANWKKTDDVIREHYEKNSDSGIDLAHNYLSDWTVEEKATLKGVKHHSLRVGNGTNDTV